MLFTGYGFCEIKMIQILQSDIYIYIIDYNIYIKVRPQLRLVSCILIETND